MARWRTPRSEQMTSRRGRFQGAGNAVAQSRKCADADAAALLSEHGTTDMDHRRGRRWSAGVRVLRGLRFQGTLRYHPDNDELTGLEHDTWNAVPHQRGGDQGGSYA